MVMHVVQYRSPAMHGYPRGLAAPAGTQQLPLAGVRLCLPVCRQCRLAPLKLVTPQQLAAAMHVAARYRG